MSPRNAVVEPTVVEDFFFEESPHGDRRRVIAVPSQQRVFSVERQHRVFEVQAQRRVYPVPRGIFG